MTPTEYLKQLEEALSKRGRNPTQYAKYSAVRTSAAKHFATLLRESIEGTGKFVPCEATEGMVVESTQAHPVNYFPLAKAAKDRAEIIEAAITAAPDRISELIGEER